MRAVVLALALAPGVAVAQERWDHRGALGLTVAAGGDARNAVAPSLVADNGWRGDLEVGATLSFTDKTELRAAGRLALFGPALGGAALVGLRNSYGERLKTFFDLDALVHVAPVFTVGPRLGFGLQFEILPVLGAYAQLAGHLGFGAGLRLGFELLLGVQLRSYLLE